MAMTKKDFEAIAEAVAEARRMLMYYKNDPSPNAESHKVAMDMVAEELATACARQYKGGYGFDRTCFLRACGMDV